MDDEDRIDELEERHKIAETKTLIWEAVVFALVGLSSKRDQIHEVMQPVWHGIRAELGENPSDDMLATVSKIRDQLSYALGRQIL